MVKKSLVSVIIPAYNAAATIDACLDSLKKQTYEPLEVIVVDDGSTDDTSGKAKKFGKVKVLKQAHQGAGQARNKGARASRGKILVFIDADMEFSVRFITDLVRPILQGKAKGTWSGEERVKNWDNVWARCFNYNFGRYQPQMIRDKKGQRKVFRAILKKEFSKVNGFDPIGYNDDWTLVEKLGYQPKPTKALFYHNNPNSLPEVFNKAVWMGQRPYKGGVLGVVFTLIRHNAAFSLLVGLAKAVRTQTPQFINFKLSFDLGISLGALLTVFKRRYH